MASAASISVLLEQAFAPWPWILLPIAMGSFALIAVSSRVALLLLKQPHRPPGATTTETIHASVQMALDALRSRLQPLAHGKTPDAVAIVDELLRTAVDIGASDIHFSPLARGLSITIRVHGGLRAVDTLPRESAELVANRLKILARVDLHVRSVPQDGRLAVEIGGNAIEARMSSLPTEGGERIVLRLVEGARSVPGLSSLGFPASVTEGLAQLLARPQGLLFVTGPVGSGKSTTLYAALSHIYQTRGETTTIVTLEDPIELKLPFAAQTQIHPKAKMTFASGLRSALRQDPNVLMVGEIRDRETADIAMQASLTGHLLLTTVHADDAIGPFTRMMDMGIEPFLLASSVAGSLSQRLVRRLCPTCRRRTPLDAGLEAKFRALGAPIEGDGCFEPVGCDACDHLGFVGRIPISELLIVDSSMRKELHEGCAADVIRQHAIERGMTPLLRDGMRLATLGETTLLEVLRVAG